MRGWGQREGEAHSGVVFWNIGNICRAVLLLLELLGSVREVLDDENEDGDNVKITFCRVSFPTPLTALEENLPAQGDV